MVTAAYESARGYIESVAKERRKNEGQFFTPPAIARHMASLFEPGKAQDIFVLDPGAGTGVLSAAVCERLSSLSSCRAVHIDAYETSKDLLPLLKRTLVSCRNFLGESRIPLTFDIPNEDFVTACAHRLGGVLPFDTSAHASRKYDLTISNPPYGKIRKNDPRSVVAAEVVHGQPNVYALFMAISARMLRHDGHFVFVVPRSFASGLYFRRFRAAFFSIMRPKNIHLFHSRREAFCDQEVLQENLILAARRDGITDRTNHHRVTITMSRGLTELGHPYGRSVPLSRVLRPNLPGAPLRIPVSPADDEAVEFVSQWPETVESLELHVSTGPVVPFRAEEFQQNVEAQDTVPFLWMQHIRPMLTEWPLPEFRKPQFLLATAASRKLLLPNANYVIVRRFSAKEESRRIVAAPFIASTFAYQQVALENHLNYIARRGSPLSVEEVIGIAAVLNAPIIDRYFRVSNGNTQVSATELRTMPLPTIDEIHHIGRELGASRTVGEAQKVVAETLRIPKHLAHNRVTQETLGG